METGYNPESQAAMPRERPDVERLQADRKLLQEIILSIAGEGPEKEAA